MVGCYESPAQTARSGAVVHPPLTLRRRPDPSTIFLWLTALSVGGAMYLYRIGVLWTVLLVMCASLFLGLVVFTLIVAPAEETPSIAAQTTGNVELPSGSAHASVTDG